MEDNFDKSIRKALENFEAEFQPMDWDKMEQKIDEQSSSTPEVDDILLDAVAYDALRNLDVEYNPNHWNLMNERIADPYALRRRLMKYKVAEVALVALFIFTLIQFLPERSIQQQDLAGINASEKLVTPAIEKEKRIDEVVASNDQAINLKENQTVIADALNTTSKISKKETKTISTTTSSIAASNIDSKNNLGNQNIDVANEHVTVNKKEELAETIFTPNTSDIIDITDIVNNTIIEEDDILSTSMLDPLALKDAEKISVPGIEEISGSKIFSNLKRPIRVRIGMVLGPDANYVMTPQDNTGLLNLSSFDQFAPGYSGGFTLGFRYNRLEIETGAIYSAVTYDSRKVFELKGSFAEGGYVYQGLVGAKLDIIRLPLNIKYNFFEKSKWNVYAFSGASLNLAVETFYDFTTQDVGRSQASNNSRFIDEQNDTKEAHEGLLEGGNLVRNSFLTANLGFGIERYFTPRMSIFLQPSYMHQFSKGLGPQSDQINSISILTGAKVTLKKKSKKKK